MSDRTACFQTCTRAETVAKQHQKRSTRPLKPANRHDPKKGLLWILEVCRWCSDSNWMICGAGITNSTLHPSRLGIAEKTHYYTKKWSWHWFSKFHWEPGSENWTYKFKSSRLFRYYFKKWHWFSILNQLIWLLKDSSENQIYLYLISFLTNNSIDFFGVKDVRIFFDKMFDRFSNLRRLFLRQGFGCILRKHCLTSILNILMSNLD